MPGECQHEHWQARVAVNRIAVVEGGPVRAYAADITAACATCGTRMVWLGLPGGSYYGHPTVSFDGTELRAPCQPQPARL